MVELKFHHTGVLVNNIEASLTHYSYLFGNDAISEIFSIESQRVKVCFIKNGTTSYLELVEPLDDNDGLSKMLKRNIGYYHIAYMVKDINMSIKILEDLNYKSFEPFNSEAFQGKPCVFLYNLEGHLVELIEE